MPLQNTFTLDVDFKFKTLINEPVVTQNDEVTFILNVYDDNMEFDLSNVSTFTLVSVRPDKQSVMTLGNKTSFNQIAFALGSTEISVVGKINAVIQIYDVDGRVSTLPFTYQVLKDPATNYVPSTDEQTLIELVLGQGPVILQAAEDATADAIQATSDLTQLKTDVTQATTDANAAASSANTEGARASAQADRASTAAQDAEDAYNMIIPVLPNIEGWGYDQTPYDATTTYERNNIISYDGSTFISLIDGNIGNTPTLNPNGNWGLIARRGIDGSGSVSTVNGVSPDANGNVSITIPDPDLSKLATKSELQMLDDELTEHRDTEVHQGIYQENKYITMKNQSMGKGQNSGNLFVSTEGDYKEIADIDSVALQVVSGSKHIGGINYDRVWGINTIVAKHIETTSSYVIGLEVSMVNDTVNHDNVIGVLSSYVGMTQGGKAAFESTGNTAGWNYGLLIDGIKPLGTGIKLDDSVSNNSGMNIGIDFRTVKKFTEGAILLGNTHEIKAMNSSQIPKRLLSTSPNNDIIIGSNFGGDGSTVIRSAGSSVAIQDGNEVNRLLVDGDSTNSIMMFVGGALKRVEIGAPDSGGSGYRILRVSN